MKLKKIGYGLIAFVMFFLFNNHAYALHAFPDYNLNYPLSDNGNPADIYYCEYNTGNVFDTNSATLGNEIYSNKKLYVGIRSDSFFYVNPDTNKPVENETEPWYNPRWLLFHIGDQHIKFNSSKLVNYLQVNGNLQCNDLYFVESGNDLHILTPDEFQNEWSFNWERDLISPNSGSLMYKGVVYDTAKCSEVTSQIHSIMNHYDDSNVSSSLKNLENAILKKLSDSSFSPTASDIQAYKEIVKRDSESINSTISDTRTKILNLASSDFNINICNGFSDDSKKAQDTLKEDASKLQDLLNQINKKLEEANEKAKEEGNTEVEEATNAALSEVDSALQNVDNVMKSIDNWISNTGIGIGDIISDASCQGILGPDLLDDISLVLTWIRISVPIIVIVMGSVDFARAVLSDDQQELKKATSRFSKRCIIAVAIFFVPSIIMYIISFINTLKDVSCDIRLW